MPAKKWIFFFFCVVTASSAVAQQTTSEIVGIIIDKASRKPIEFANVELLKISDSSLVKGNVTDNKGKFLLEQVKPGDYLLRSGFIGYDRSYVHVAVIAKPRINIGTIEIGVSSKIMSDVTVTATRALLNTSIDRKSYDVTKDIMAQSGSASDVLKNIPSVEVDLDGQVSLRGSSDVMILVNGRPSPLMGKLRVAEVLQQLPANSIERIEVITNPSARYKPDGTSGIINIVMKKNTKGGWNGSITANTGNQDRDNISAILNYKPGKLNVFGNYGIRQDSRTRTNDITRTYLDQTTFIPSSYYTEHGVSVARPLTHLATLGLAYDPSKNNSFGISGNYSNRDQVKNDVVNKFFYDKTHVLSGTNDRLRYDPEYEKEKDLTGFWEHNFPGEDHTLRVELNVSTSQEQEDNHYQNAYHYPVTYSTYDNTLIRQGDNQQQLTIDYNHTLTESSKLELGYSGTFNQQDFNFYGEYYDPVSAKFIADKIKTNRFLFDQSIHGLYGTYQKSYEKFSYSVGLRLEESLIKGNQVTKDTLINNDYLKLYPTVHLAYQLKKGQLQLNYSRRVHRPEGDDINPFPEYQDPYNVRAGNARLLPEIIHSVEFGYKYQDKNFSFVPSLYYRYKQNGFTQVTVPLNDSVLLTTQQNLTNDQSAGLELIFSVKAGKFFSSNLSTNFFYNQINASNLGYFDKKTIISFSTNFNSTFVITPNTMAQISANYRSARLTPQGKNYPSFVFNMGMRQDLFKKKVSVLLAVSDLFRTQRERSELNSGYLNQESIRRRDAQILYIGVSYRFGKATKKAEEKIQFDNGQ
jgi:outer membrane receptor protein involved in Fe transport